MVAPVIAVVGGGQLARMMAPAAAELGVHLRVLVEDEHSSAAQVVVDALVGRADDPVAVASLVGPARGPAAAVLTFEHEHVPDAVLAPLTGMVPVRPAPGALRYAQDKIQMRTRLGELGVPCPAWMSLPAQPEAARAALARFLDDHGGSAVVKTARGGYDGKGVRVITDPGQVADWIAATEAGGPELLVEERVPFTRELAALVARRPSGQVAAWPVVESVQRDGVCSEVIAPAPGLDPAMSAAAQEIATGIATGLDVTGVLAVEMFETPDGRLLVNELAMRPHNCGHWTIDGAATSQFAQHLRAVLDLPLGPTQPLAPWTVMVNVLGSTLADPTQALDAVLSQVPGARVNLYGKDVRPGRKLGHVTVVGDDLDQVRHSARIAARLLEGEQQ